MGQGKTKSGDLSMYIIDHKTEYEKDSYSESLHR